MQVGLSATKRSEGSTATWNLRKPLGAHQERIVEGAAVGEVDLDGLHRSAQANLQVDHRAFAQAVLILVLAVAVVGAVLDLADARQHCSNTEPSASLVASRKAPTLSPSRWNNSMSLADSEGGVGAGVHLRLQGAVQLRQETHS